MRDHSGCGCVRVVQLWKYWKLRAETLDDWRNPDGQWYVLDGPRNTVFEPWLRIGETFSSDHSVLPSWSLQGAVLLYQTR